jgi:N utilization substance protein B
MSSRRIARELAVILLPQLPKEKGKLQKTEMDKLAAKAVHMLTDYAKQCLSEANGFIVKAQEALLDQVIEHQDNVTQVHEIRPITLKSDELEKHLDLMERALHLTAEALDIPQMSLGGKETEFLFQIVSSYIENAELIDRLINRVKDKYRVERMVTIDRDIIRLAVAEAFFMPDVPINVAISEAVELSHRFADDKAAKFINGVLSDLAEQAKVYRATGKTNLDDATSNGDQASMKM